MSETKTLPPCIIKANRKQILELTNRLYGIGMQQVATGDADPTLKRSLAAARKTLQKHGKK